MTTLTIKRNDYFGLRLTENSYTSPHEIQNGIDLHTINQSLVKMTKCLNTKHAENMIIYLIVMIIIPPLTFGVLYPAYGTDTFNLLYPIMLSATEAILIIAILLNYFVNHRPMVKRAQHIVDIENSRQNTYILSINHFTLSINVKTRLDTEVHLVTDPSYLKEIIAISDFNIPRYHDDILVAYFSGSRAIFSAAYYEYQKYYCKYYCLRLLAAVVIVCSTTGILYLIINHYEGENFTLVCLTTVFVGLFVLLGTVGMLLYCQRRRFLLDLEAKNNETKMSGICYDLVGSMLYVYKFEIFDVNGSFKKDSRTAKYFK
jgi:hypothetical protein